MLLPFFVSALLGGVRAILTCGAFLGGRCGPYI